MKQRVAKLLGDSLAKSHGWHIPLVLREGLKAVRMGNWGEDFSVYSEDRNDLLTSIVSDLGLASKVKPQSIYVWSKHPIPTTARSAMSIGTG